MARAMLPKILDPEVCVARESTTDMGLAKVRVFTKKEYRQLGGEAGTAQVRPPQAPALEVDPTAQVTSAGA